MRTERLQDDLAAMREAWEQSEGFWNGERWDQQAEYERMKELLFQAWEEWNEYCLEWYQIGEEGKLI